MNRRTVYRHLTMRMKLMKISMRQLSRLTGIGYASLRCKLRGESRITLDEAVRVRDALAPKESVERLFGKP